MVGEGTVSVSCDNYSYCHGYFETWDNQSAPEDQLRAAGWHTFHGLSETGKWLDVYLCPVCTGNIKRPRPPKILDGQLGLDIEIPEPPVEKDRP